MAKNNFDINDLLGGASNTVTNNFTRLVSYKNIIEHENNIYSMSDIEELAESIDMYGLQQNLVVKTIQGSKDYLLVTGHRRLRAIKYLIEEKGRTELEKIPCKIDNSNEDEIITELKLHETNIQSRVMTDAEILAVVSRLDELIEMARAEGVKLQGKEVGGKTREIISKYMGKSETTVQKFLTVAKDPEATEAVEAGASVNKAVKDLKARKSGEKTKKGSKSKKKVTADKMLKESMAIMKKVKAEDIAKSPEAQKLFVDFVQLMTVINDNVNASKK